jgi:UDP-glucose 6-dehydrogenase
MRVTVIGCGRLGATHAASTASIGHEALGLGIEGNVGGVPIEGGRPDE